MFRNRLFLKGLALVGLCLALLIPLSMINGLVIERGYHKQQAIQSVVESTAGEQRLTGMVLVVDYFTRHHEKVWDKATESHELVPRERWHQVFFLPESLSANALVNPAFRSRGIYEVPIYDSNWTVDGHFDQAAIQRFSKEKKNFLKWGKARLVMGVTDARGISEPSLQLDGKALELQPGTGSTALGQGVHATLQSFDPAKLGVFSLGIALRGTQRLAFSPIANDTRVIMKSSWPHPKFDGKFLPFEREVSAEGFSADWRVSAFSTSATQTQETCSQLDCATFMQPDFGVQLIEPVDLYYKVRRSVEYGILFILMTFVAFFLVETLLKKELHAVNYILVGFSLAIFYLLLLSLSEHLGFALAYLLATVACASLIAYYLSGVLNSRRGGMAFGAAIGALYAMLFVILHSEDFALLMGSILLFAGLVQVMVMTRKVNWRAIGRVEPGNE